MLAWIRTPRGSTMTATVVAVILALFWLEPWQKPLPVRLPFTMPFFGGGDAPPVAPASQAEGQPSSAPPAPAPVASAASPGQSATPQKDASVENPALRPATEPRSPQPGIAAAPAAGTPGFDIVRVEPTGDTVIAGRAEPGSDVALLDGETVIGHVQADAAGEFTLLPNALSEGSHYLTLQTRKPGGEPVKSAQGVAVSVAKNGGTKPLVALLTPDKPAEVLSDGSGLNPSSGGGKAAAGGVPVAIQAVEAGQGGQFTAAGVAHPGSQCRVYLNGAYLADVTAGKDGRWSVEIKKGMKPGRYSVRADELEPGSGKVVHRAEVPFDYPTTLAGDAPAQSLLARKDGSSSSIVLGGSGAVTSQGAAMQPGGAAAAQHVASAADETAGSVAPAAPASSTAADAAAVIPDLHSTTVISGDSLWRISRKMLGHGIKYTEIYASNVKQIKNPALIYPGQIFVVPSPKPN